METGRVLGTPEYSEVKDEWVEIAFEHHASCDTLKMLDDLPESAFSREDDVVHIRVTQL
jgi:hypothetical protein